MRYIIGIEGRQMFPQQLIEANAFRFPLIQPIPIVGINNNFDKIVGRASDLRREDEGIITAEVEIFDEDAMVLLERGDVGVTVYCKQVIYERIENVSVVSSAMIFSCFITPDVPWKGKQVGDLIEAML